MAHTTAISFKHHSSTRSTAVARAILRLRRTLLLSTSLQLTRHTQYSRNSSPPAPPSMSQQQQLASRGEGRLLTLARHLLGPDETSAQQHTQQVCCVEACVYPLNLYLGTIATASGPVDLTPQTHPHSMQVQLKLSAEVQHALQNNKPVVALESTIISHGGLSCCW